MTEMLPTTTKYSEVDLTPEVLYVTKDYDLRLGQFRLQEYPKSPYIRKLGYFVVHRDTEVIHFTFNVLGMAIRAIVATQRDLDDAKLDPNGATDNPPDFGAN